MLSFTIKLVTPKLYTSYSSSEVKETLLASLLLALQLAFTGTAGAS